MASNHQLIAIKNTFDLRRHPEGGSFVETYRSQIKMDERSAATAIYFLLEENDFSAFHRLRSDEIWHFYLGGPLKIIEIDLHGKLITTVLGPDLTAGHKLQHTVPAGHWFGSIPLEGTEFSFVGCTVAPGFEYADFELAKREELTKIFPQHSKVIAGLTR